MGYQYGNMRTFLTLNHFTKLITRLILMSSLFVFFKILLLETSSQVGTESLPVSVARRGKPVRQASRQLCGNLVPGQAGNIATPLYNWQTADLDTDLPADAHYNGFYSPEINKHRTK